MVLWRGHLSFRQYVTTKRHVYGIKLYMLADHLGLTQKLHVHGGRGEKVWGRGTDHNINKVTNQCEKLF